MKIGNRKYKVKSSDCWLIFPSKTLTVNVWTEQEKTYLLVEPITFKSPQKLLSSLFQSEFDIEEIVDIDTTLLENDKAIEIWNQEVKFDNQRLFKFNQVSIKGKTEDNEEVEVNTETSFLGFEIWKEGDYLAQVTEIESVLNKISIPFQTIDETDNDLIRIKIKTEPNRVDGQ